MKIIFIGTPKFASIILEKLAKTEYKPVLVITAPDKKKGRGNPLSFSDVKITAQKHGIGIEQPEKIIDIKNKISEVKPDLIVLTAYGEIIPKSILDIPKFGALNIHPSLLPKYRGASPIQGAILNGDEETGVTIYKMDEKMDHGPLLRSSSTRNFGGQAISKISYSELYEKLAELGADLLIKTIPKIFNNEIKPTPQNEAEATYTKIIKKEDGHINWNKPAIEIEKQIRAYNPWPGSYSFWNGKTLKIIESSVKLVPVKNDFPLGKVVLSPENEILVATKENYLKIEKLQIEGKKPQTAKEFLNGYKDIIGEILC